MAVTAKKIQQAWWKLDGEINDLLYAFEQGAMAMGFSPKVVAAKTAGVRKAVKAMKQITDDAVAESDERVI